MSRERGAVLAEFGIVIPILLLVVFTLFEFGRFTITATGVSSAVRDATRYGIAVADGDNGVPRYVDCDAIRAAASGTSLFGRPDPSDVTVAYDHGPGTAEFMTCPAGTTASPSSVQTGDRIVVRIDSVFRSMVPFASIFLDEIDLSAEGKRTIVKDLS
jgi:Flp pilus assembly protein TadG